MNLKHIFLACLLLSQAQCLEVTDSGGYSSVVVRLDDSLQEQNCSVIIDNIQSFLVSSSSSLFSSLAGKFYQSNIFCGPGFRPTIYFIQSVID